MDAQLQEHNHDDSPLHDESTNQGNWRPYNSCIDQLKDHSYRSLENGYAEINEAVQRNVSNRSTVLVDMEDMKQCPEAQLRLLKMLTQ